jgi:hypothetical protein
MIERPIQLFYGWSLSWLLVIVLPLHLGHPNLYISPAFQVKICDKFVAANKVVRPFVAQKKIFMVSN